MNPKYPKFEFELDGVTEEQAELLLNIIVAFVKAVDGEFGGGYTMEGGDDEQEVKAAE